jgi:hypothetical protein
MYGKSTGSQRSEVEKGRGLRQVGKAKVKDEVGGRAVREAQTEV